MLYADLRSKKTHSTEESNMKKTLKFVSTLLILILACSALTGCGKKPVTKAEIEKAATVTDNLIAGINSHDYKIFSADFDANMLEQMKEPDFESLIVTLEDTIGLYQSHTLSESQRILNAGTELLLFTYTAKYDKEPGDVTITVYLTEKNDDLIISGFSFDSPELRKTEA